MEMAETSAREVCIHLSTAFFCLLDLSLDEFEICSLILMSRFMAEDAFVH